MTDTTAATGVPTADATWPAAGVDHGDPRPATSLLPRWPFAILFVGFPAWWILGLVDVIWIPVAMVMAAYLVQCRAVRAPQGFGLYLFFLAWSAASVVMVVEPMSLLTFGYRSLLYLSAGVLLVYLYNARRSLTAQYVCGCMVAWWVTTVVGGYAGIALPETVVRTPASYLLPRSLLSNELVDHMVVRRLTEYDPNTFLQIAPRPAAPFLYTNNWGNAYSLLLPFVVAYLLQVRRGPRFWVLVVLLAASTVPAMLTLNRGMFLGIGLALAYVSVRAVMARHWRTIGGVVAVLVLGVAVYAALPVGERLQQRLDERAEGTSTDARASLYLQAIDLVPGSPLFGYGVPQTGLDPDAPPVGTHGQVWMLLVSHGPVATVCFVAFFVVALLSVVRRRDLVGLLSSTVLLVGTVELLYYGALPYGLPLLMVAAGLGLRPEPPEPPVPTGRRAGRPPG